jgi:hypothetical protein
MAKSFSLEEALGGAPKPTAAPSKGFSLEDALGTRAAKPSGLPAGEDLAALITPAEDQPKPERKVYTGSVFDTQPFDPKFDPVEAEKLSRRAYAEKEQTRPRRTQSVRATPEDQIDRSVGRAIADTGIGLLQGAVSIPKGIASNINAGDNPVAKFYEEAIQAGERSKSPFLRSQSAEREALLKNVLQNQGELAQTRAAFTSMFSPSGADIVSQGAGSMLPVVGMSLLNLGQKSFVAMNALANAGDAAQSTARKLSQMSPEDWSKSDAYQELRSSGLSHADSVRMLAPLMAMPSQLVGGGAGFIAGGTGLEKSLVGGAIRGGSRERAARAGSEALGEQLETLAPSLAGNITQRMIDERTSPTEGLGREAVETLFGSVPGAALAASGRSAPDARPELDTSGLAERMARERGFLATETKRPEERAAPVQERVEPTFEPERVAAEPSAPRQPAQEGRDLSDLDDLITQLRQPEVEPTMDGPKAGDDLTQQRAQERSGVLEPEGTTRAPERFSYMEEAAKYDTPEMRLKQADALGDDVLGLVFGEAESYGRAALKKKSLTAGYAEKKDNRNDAADAATVAFGTGDYSVFTPYERLFPKTAAKLKAALAPAPEVVAPKPKQAPVEKKPYGLPEFFSDNEKEAARITALMESGPLRPRIALSEANDSIQRLADTIQAAGFDVDNLVPGQVPDGIMKIKTQIGNIAARSSRLAAAAEAVQKKYKRADPARVNTDVTELMADVEQANDLIAEDQNLPSAAEQMEGVAPPVSQEVEELLKKSRLASEDIETLSKRSSGTSLMKVLEGTLKDGEMSELGGRSRQIGKNPFISLVAKKGKRGSSMEDMVESGKLNLFLPFGKRSGEPGYDNAESAEYIREKLRIGEFYTDDIRKEIEAIQRGIWSIDEEIQQELSLEDINREIQYAVDEQRAIDQEAETIASEGAPEALDEGTRGEDELDKREAQLDREEELNQREARLLEERKRLEEERLKLESPTKQDVADQEERKAKAAEADEREQIRKESEAGAGQFELTREEGRQDTTGGLFDQPVAEPAPVEISTEEERKKAIDQLKKSLSTQIPPFRARGGNNRVSILKPTPLSRMLLDEVLKLVKTALDLGLPPAVLGNVKAAGGTRSDTIAMMTNNGWLMIGKQWSTTSQPEKLLGIIHEIGHAVDYSGGVISDKPKWDKAHTELKEWYRVSADKFRHPLAYPFASQYKGKVRPKQESFAQAFGYYFTSPVDLQKNAPEAYSQIQAIIERIQNESQAARAAGATATGTAGIKVQPTRTAQGAAAQPAAGQQRTDVSATARLEDRGAGKVTKAKFYEDIPNENWLQGKIDYAMRSPRNEFGVPKMSSITGSFKAPVMVPTRWFQDAKGQRGEEKNVRQKDLEAIRKIIRDTGKFPLNDDGTEYVPYVEIGYDGKPWVSEGNHRIMAAIAEGMEYMPIELRYFDGGQRRAGKFAPENIKEITDRLAEAEAVDINAMQPPPKEELKKLGDTWLLGRDKAGNVGFGPGAKAYSAIADIANTVLDKIAMKPVSPELGRAMRNMKARVDQVQNKIGEVAAEMNKLSKDEREMISDIIEGELKADVHPPQHVLNLAASIQSMMSRQSQELVELGMLSKEAANRWDNKYLPRFYETKLRDEVNAWAKATRDLFKKQPMMRGIKGSQLRARGLFEVIDTKDLPDYLDLGWEQRDPDFNPKTSDSTIVWRDYNRAERENMGEIRDAMFRFVMGYNASQRDIALGRLYKDLAENYASKFPLEGYVQVPETKAEGTQTPRYGKLEGLYVPKEVMDHLSANDEAMANGILKLYRAGLSKWKEGKTVLNPVSHANNVISNLTMAHFAGVSYWDAIKYGGAVKDFVTKNPMVKEAQDVGVFGGSFNNSELVKSMPSELRAMANMTESRLARFGERIWDTLAFTIEAKGTKYGARPVMQWAYEGEDMFFRYLIYRDARGRGMSPEDARDYSQEYIFTYDDLPKGARAVRDYGMPFFSYTYKVVPVLARTALVYPWRYAAPATIAYTVNALMYAIAANMGGNEDDWWTTTLYRYMTDEDFRNKAKALESEERKLLPEWMKGQSAILSTPKAIRMGMDEVTKLPMFLDISRIFPGGDLLDANNNSGGVALLQPLTPSNPVLTSLVAMLANRDMFLGKDVVNKTDTDAEKAQKRAAWLWKQITPAISVGNYHFDRTMSTIANMTGEPITIDAGPMGTVSYTGVGKDGLPVQPKHAMLQTMGIKIRPYDLELSRNIEESSRRQAVREIDLQITRINRQESKNVISSEAAQIERDKLLKKRGFISEGLTPEGKPKK